MRLLFVDAQYPMPDRASADVRMSAIVTLLRQLGHECDYLVTDLAGAESRIGRSDVDRYRVALQSNGVRTHERKGFERVLAEQSFDAIYFKYFYPAERRISVARSLQPRARIVVDSVDLVFARLGAKAQLSGLEADHALAAQTEARELGTYAAADVVITVTGEEQQLLAQHLPQVPVHVIPNIHHVPVDARVETPFPSLLFIGTFSHEPNVDGVLWFVRAVWPTIRRRHPDAQFRIVGGHAPPEIQTLHGGGVHVMGYVPNTQALLRESWVSVAPLRFGAGMKGKVGEAMAAGLPVVATSFGAEGFGLSPGTHVLVADDAEGFADAVSSLMADGGLRRRLGLAGRAFIDARFSPTAVTSQLVALVDRLENMTPRRIRFDWLRGRVKRSALWAQRNMLWRLKRGP